MTKFEKYVDNVEKLITDYTKNLTSDEIHEIEETIENSQALFLSFHPRVKPQEIIL